MIDDLRVMNQACNHFRVLSGQALACFHLRTAGSANGKTRSTNLFSSLHVLLSSPHHYLTAPDCPCGYWDRNQPINGAEDEESRFIVLGDQV